MVTIKREWAQIIEALIAEPSATLKEIADRTGIPKSSVWYAQKRLQEDGLINLLLFPQLDEVDGLKIGLIGGAINGDKETVLEQVADHKNVWFLVDTIGPHAFTAGIVGKDAEEFQAVIDEISDLGAEGDHYGEVIAIREFGLDSEFMQSLQ
jgi:DNA-binding Lrp family transcriptional regulator